VRLGDAALEQLLARFGPQGATTVILLAVWFNLLSRFLQSTRVELEAPGAVAQRTGPVSATDSREAHYLPERRMRAAPIRDTLPPALSVPPRRR
jgi:hypothetical protein